MCPDPVPRGFARAAGVGWPDVIKAMLAFLQMAPLLHMLLLCWLMDWFLGAHRKGWSKKGPYKCSSTLEAGL